MCFLFSQKKKRRRNENDISLQEDKNGKDRSLREDKTELSEHNIRKPFKLTCEMFSVAEKTLFITNGTPSIAAMQIQNIISKLRAQIVNMQQLCT